MNKHVNKVRKVTGRAEAITAGRQQNKQRYLIIQLMKKKESIKTGQERLGKREVLRSLRFCHCSASLFPWNWSSCDTGSS